VQVYEAVDELLKVFVPKERLDAMDMGERFSELLQTMNGEPQPEQKGTFPPLLNRSLFTLEDIYGEEPEPHPKIPRLGQLAAGLTEILGNVGAWLPGKKEFAGPSSDPKQRFSSTAGTRPSPPRGPGSPHQNRRMSPGPLQTNWSEIIEGMVDLIGGPIEGPPNTSPVQEQDRQVGAP